MQAALSITATPTVNTGSINAALAKAAALRAALASFGAAAAGVVKAATPAPSRGFAFGGPRAKGGPVRRDIAHLVGEKGMELFVPSEDGTIVRNYQLGGRGGMAVGGSSAGAAPNVTQHNTFHLRVEGGGDAEAIANRVLALATRKLKESLIRSRQILVGGISNYEY